eukprot:TRINITY_DN3085_c0_g1_i1.p1 TRINITY_DN3085_c0_g1~~TRINITY_DN3085_c0_g1_i1.p1  ORF type:complete len:755 (+),score=203.44 TRINITY_DN3085_c0_g1_i1:73-2265(+)
MRGVYLLVVLFALCGADGKNLLFIGNSYTYVGDMPGVVRQVAASMGHTVTVESKVAGGRSLGQASQDNGVITRLNAGGFDYLILQDQSQTGPACDTWNWENKNLAYKAMVDLFSPAAKASSAKIVMYETWGYREGHEWYGDTYKQMQSMCIDGYELYSDITKRQGCMAPEDSIIAHAGTAFSHVYDQSSSADPGTDPNTLFYKLYNADKSHPDPLGTYLIALTMCYTMFGIPADTSTLYKPGYVTVNPDYFPSLHDAALKAVTPPPAPLPGMSGGYVDEATDRRYVSRGSVLSRYCTTARADLEVVGGKVTRSPDWVVESFTEEGVVWKKETTGEVMKLVYYYNDTCSVTGSPTATPTNPPQTTAPTPATAEPTATPTLAPPTATPTAAPTGSPKTGVPATAAPTGVPTTVPSTSGPTASPGVVPATTTPTESPTTVVPTANPTVSPATAVPTASPTTTPTAPATMVPTANPTASPPTTAPATIVPTASPTTAPVTVVPTRSPTMEPTAPPTTSPATVPPTGSPTGSPPTGSPTGSPPTGSPTTTTTGAPGTPPTGVPTTTTPTAVPTRSPRAADTAAPTTASPTTEPASKTTSEPSREVTGSPTAVPTTAAPPGSTAMPTTTPTSSPQRDAVVPTSVPLPDKASDTNVPTTTTTTTPATAAPQGNGTLEPTPAPSDDREDIVKYLVIAGLAVTTLFLAAAGLYCYTQKTKAPTMGELPVIQEEMGDKYE